METEEIISTPATTETENSSPATPRMEITEGMKSDLLEATKWFKFITIMGTIGIALCALAGVVMLLASMIGHVDASYTAAGIIYVVVAVVYIPILSKSFALVNQARTACLLDSSDQLAAMFDTMRSLAKYTGILTIVVIAIYVIAIIVGIAAIGFFALI